MQDTFNALLKALKCLFHPKMLSLILWPMFLATLFWGGTAYYFWHDWVNILTDFAGQFNTTAYLQRHELSWIAGYFISFILFLLLLPVIYTTALLITSIFAMPLMVSHIASKDFPNLELKHGGTVAGSVWNGLVAILIYVILWVITIPLWLFTPFAVLIPILLTAYLNQRLFRYDALADHASAPEFEKIMERSSTKFYIMGAALALLQFVPILQFFTPVYIGLAFIYLSLTELEVLRKTST